MKMSSLAIALGRRVFATDLAGEEPAAVVVEAFLHGGEARLTCVEQPESAGLGRNEVVGEQCAD